MIIVLTDYLDEDSNEIVVSHGIDIETDKVIILPPVPPETIAKRDGKTGEWVLVENQ